MSDRRTVELDMSDLVARPMAADTGNDDTDGDTTPRRNRRLGAEATAEKRRVAAELRERNRLERQAIAAQKKAERTRSQVRLQALNLGRKYHSVVASAKAPYEDADNTMETAATASGELQLAPIVRHADGALFLANTRGGGGGGDGGRQSEFENSFQTLQKLALAPTDPPPRRAVVDASGGMPVTQRTTFVHQQQQLPGISVSPRSPLTAEAAPETNGVVPFFAPTAGTFTLPGIAIGDSSAPSSSSSSSIASPAAVPQFGVLRGGSLPSMRRRNARRDDFVLGMSEDQRREQARLERELQDLAVTKQYENLTRLYNTLPELRPRTAQSRSGDGGGITRRRYVPQQRRTVRRVFRVGRTPDGDQLSMLTHSTATKASVDDFRLQMQNMSTDKMRRALLAAKILTAGSEAPEALVRRIFHQRQLIVGDLAMAPIVRKRPHENNGNA